MHFAALLETVSRPLGTRCWWRKGWFRTVTLSTNPDSVVKFVVKKFFIPSKENVGATHKEQRQCTDVTD